MKDRLPKTKGPGTPGLTLLAKGEEAALQDQVSRIKQALEANQDLEALKELAAPLPEAPAFQLHLLNALGNIAHPAIPPLLAALFSETSHRQVRKALKRALHLLKTRGVPVPADLFPRDEVSILHRGEIPALQAFVSPVYGPGDRLVVVESNQETFEGNFLVVRINDQQGFQECHPLSIKRKARNEIWEKLRQDGLDDWVSVPLAYAMGLLEEAYKAGPREGNAAIMYRSIREKLMARVNPEEESQVAKLLPSLEPPQRQKWLQQSPGLAREKLFLTWLPPMPEVTPWLMKLKEIRESPLVLSEFQQKERTEAVLDEAVASFFPPEKRTPWGHRLLEMAYFLDRQGEWEKARAAQAAGEDLLEKPESLLVAGNPFLTELAWVALLMGARLLDEVQGASQEAGGILKPNEPLIIKG